MVSKMKRASENEEKKGRVKVGKLKATKELSAAEAKNVKGGKASLSEIKIVHIYDKATPVLIQS